MWIVETRRPEAGEFPPPSSPQQAPLTGRLASFWRSSVRNLGSNGISARVDLEPLRRRMPVATDLPERAGHARDLWPRSTLTLATEGTLPPLPAAVAWPRDEEEVALALEWAEIGRAHV